MDLKGKNIALVCPKFYGYEELIANELRARGANVYLIFENLEWVSIRYRLVYVYFPKRKEKLFKKYYTSKLKNISKELDYFIAIRGSSLRPDTMEWIKKSCSSKCKFIMYQWDGVKNNETILNIAGFFDRVLTFDKTDALKQNWLYRPLFFMSDYTDLNVSKDIDILFICSLHSNRAKILNQLKVIANEKGYKLKVVAHLNRFLFYKYKYINKKAEVIEADNKDLSFKPLSIRDSYKLYSRSKVVVDYTNLNQTGFTMRTIESVGNRCKIVTNNKLILDSDFYDEQNISVYDEDKFAIPDHFVNEPYKNIPDEVYSRYDLKKWIDDLIGETI